MHVHVCQESICSFEAQSSSGKEPSTVKALRGVGWGGGSSFYTDRIFTLFDRLPGVGSAASNSISLDFCIFACCLVLGMMYHAVSCKRRPFRPRSHFWLARRKLRVVCDPSSSWEVHEGSLLQVPFFLGTANRESGRAQPTSHFALNVLATTAPRGP